MENVNSKNDSIRWKLARLAYRGLVYSIASKAVEYNAPIVFVDPRNTSSTCSMCGSRLGYVSRVAICTKCGLKMDRDSVGSDKHLAEGCTSVCGVPGSPLSAPTVKDEAGESGGIRNNGVKQVARNIYRQSQVFTRPEP